jgi:hypothetical protein
VTDLLAKWRALPLMWSEAIRALVCLIPLLGRTDPAPLRRPSPA